MVRAAVLSLCIAALLLSGCSHRPNPVNGNSFHFKLDKMTANNKKFEISYAFREDAICYTPSANIYPIGHMVLVNKDDKTLKLFDSDLFIALLKMSDDEVLAAVRLKSGAYSVLNWYNELLDSYEYRLDIPAKQTVRIPLRLDVRYAAEKVIRQTIGKDSEITVEVYPCDFGPGSAKVGSERLPATQKLAALKMTLPDKK